MAKQGKPPDCLESAAQNLLCSAEDILVVIKICWDFISRSTLEGRC